MSNTKRAGLTLLCLCIFAVAGCKRVHLGGVIDTAIYPDQKHYRIWIEAHNIAVQPGELSDDAQQILAKLAVLLEYIDTKRMFQISDQ